MKYSEIEKLYIQNKLNEYEKEELGNAISVCLREIRKIALDSDNHKVTVVQENGECYIEFKTVATVRTRVTCQVAEKFYKNSKKVGKLINEE